MFRVGQDWVHEARFRETMKNNSFSVCPLYLLYKDHKQWDGSGPPKTRPVASASSGGNFHFSELLREAAKNILSGSLNLAAFGRKALTPPSFATKVTYPP